MISRPLFAPDVRLLNFVAGPTLIKFGTPPPSRTWPASFGTAVLSAHHRPWYRNLRSARGMAAAASNAAAHAAVAGIIDPRDDMQTKRRRSAPSPSRSYASWSPPTSNPQLAMYESPRHRSRWSRVRDLCVNGAVWPDESGALFRAPFHGDGDWSV